MTTIFPMVKVQSLSTRIVLQFTVILLPLVAVLIYATTAEAGRVASVSDAQQLNRQLVEVKRHYRSFTDGAADAVDLGRLAPRAMRELRDSATGVERALGKAAVVALDFDELTVQLLGIADRRDAARFGGGRVDQHGDQRQQDHRELQNDPRTE